MPLKHWRRRIAERSDDLRKWELSRSRSQDSAEAGSGDAKEKTQQIPQALTGRGEKTAKGNGHDCGGQKDADDQDHDHDLDEGETLSLARALSHI